MQARSPARQLRANIPDQSSSDVSHWYCRALIPTGSSTIPPNTPQWYWGPPGAPHTPVCSNGSVCRRQCRRCPGVNTSPSPVRPGAADSAVLCIGAQGDVRRMVLAMPAAPSPFTRAGGAEIIRRPLPGLMRYRAASTSRTGRKTCHRPARPPDHHWLTAGRLTATAPGRAAPAQLCHPVGLVGDCLWASGPTIAAACNSKNRGRMRIRHVSRCASGIAGAELI